MTEHLERAIHLHQQALQVFTREAMPTKWASTTMHLARAHASRGRGEQLENIERALQLYGQTLSVVTREENPLLWARIVWNRSTAYFWRIAGSKADNIDRAIVLAEQAREIIDQATHASKWVKLTSDLATFYTFRIRGERNANVQRAIGLYEKALAACRREANPMTYASISMNLAIAYYAPRTGARSEDIERAVELCEDVRSLRSQDHEPTEWAIACMNLGIAYIHRAEGDRTDNTKRAISLYDDALELINYETMPRLWLRLCVNLTEALLRSHREVAGESHDRAALLCQQILDRVTIWSEPSIYERVQRRLGEVWLEEGRWSDASSAFDAALQARELLYYSGTTSEARIAEISTFTDLPALAAYALLRSETEQHARLLLAARLLDQSRARWLREELMLDVDRPPAVPHELWKLFTTKRNVIREIEGQLRQVDYALDAHAYVPLADTAGRTRIELTHTIELIRTEVGDFMSEGDADEVVAASQAEPLVYLSTTKHSGIALIVFRSDVTLLWLDALTDRALANQLDTQRRTSEQSGYMDALDHLRGDGNLSAVRAWQSTLDNMLLWLEQTAMRSIADVLCSKGVGRATLIPTGKLGLLPLHGTSSASRIVWSYAPNARAVRAAQESSRRAQDQRIMVVCNPDGSLGHADLEMQAASDLFPKESCTVLSGSDANLRTVQGAMRVASVWHLAAHGKWGGDSPLSSEIALANGERITLAQILGMKVIARLAILSACESGVAGRTAPDEVISFPAGLLCAGAAGVISSMWPVKDLSTALLIARFYEEWIEKRCDPPLALALAQRWIQRTTSRGFAEWLHCRGDAYRQAEMWFLLAPNQQEQPFAHPHYWAGFHYTGV